MADFTIRLDIRVSPSLFRWGIAGLLLSSLAGDLASENVQLTTYYPAPSGVYTQMVTTNNTYIARDTAIGGAAGGRVGVGTTNIGSLFAVTGNYNGNGATVTIGNGYDGSVAPNNGMIVQSTVGIGTSAPRAGNLLDVNGSAAIGTYSTANTAPANGMIVSGVVGLGLNNPNGANELGVTGSAAIGTYGTNAAPANGLIVSGTVGIGTNAPGNKLQIVGLGAANIDLNVNGRIQTGDGSGDGGVWLDNTDTEFVGQDGTSAGIWVAGYGWAVNVNQTGRVGIESANPAYASMDVGGDGVVLARQTGCSVTHYVSGTTNCPAGYATMEAGHYSNYSACGSDPVGTNDGATPPATALIGITVQGGGTMLCCPYPGGGSYPFP